MEEFILIVVNSDTGSIPLIAQVLLFYFASHRQILLSARQQRLLRDLHEIYPILPVSSGNLGIRGLDLPADLRCGASPRALSRSRSSCRGELFDHL